MVIVGSLLKPILCARHAAERHRASGTDHLGDESCEDIEAPAIELWPLHLALSGIVCSMGVVVECVYSWKLENSSSWVSPGPGAFSCTRDAPSGPGCQV